MLSGSTIASVIAISTAVVCSSIGLFALIKNPHLKSSRMFILLALVGVLTSLADLLLINSPNEGAALVLARPVMFLTTLLAALMLYMTAYLPYEQRTSWFVRHKREYGLAMAFAAVIPAALNGTVGEDQFGWWITDSMPEYIWYGVVYSCYLTSLALFLGRLRRDKPEEQKYLILPTLGVLIPMLSAAVVEAFTLSGHSTPPMLSPTLLASSLCFGYSIFHQRLFVVKAAGEGVRPKEGKPLIEPGRVVLIEGRSGSMAYGLFVNEVASGRPGLLITSSDPEQVKEMYGLKNTPILCLTTRPGMDNVDPTSLSILTHTAVKFLHNGQAPVVLLDGLEYLGAHNQFEKVMHLVYELRDATITTCSKLIIPVDPGALKSKYLSMLERELEPMKAPQTINHSDR